MGKFTEAKNLVLNYFEDLERCSTEELPGVFERYISSEYDWKGSYPFRHKESGEAVLKDFWIPLKTALTGMQRRKDIFIAGNNEFDGTVWVMCMGHFMGLFDNDWLGIKKTRKLNSLRFAEFNCVENGKITKSGIFMDIIGFMNNAGINPLPPSTGQFFVYPGPITHDGLLFEDADPEEGKRTLNLVNEMVDSISANMSAGDRLSPDTLSPYWSEQMLWMGPCGVGATYTIPRYQEQHQIPFRAGLSGKKFNGHVVRFAEGDFACFFGWPNLSNTAKGGFMGLPGGNVESDMVVVDVYHRIGGKLAENWVIIDMPYWLKGQGLDILERTSKICNP